jgi:hypothetical protein
VARQGTNRLRNCGCGRIGSAFVFALLPFAGHAQDIGPGGVQYRFGLSQSFAGDTDFGLQSPGTRGVVYGTSRLSFGISSETRRERITLTAGGSLRIASSFTRSGADTIDAAEPSVELSYARESATAGLSFSASYTREAVAFVGAFRGIVGPDGTLLPLEAPADGVGERGTTSLSARLNAGRGGPLSFDFGISAARTDLFGTTDPDLEESRRADADLSANLALTRELQALLRFEAGWSEDDDAAGSRTETGRMLVGLSYEPSGDLALSALAGPVWQRERAFGIASEDNGATGLLSLRWTGPRSELDFSLSGTEVGDDRSYGASLAWLHTMQDGLFTARTSYTITPGDVIDPGETTTFLGLGFLQELTPVSQMGLALVLGSTETDGVVGTDEYVSIGASYRRDITRDVAIQTGYQFRSSEDVLRGNASSHGLYFELSFNTEGLF